MSVLYFSLGTCFGAVVTFVTIRYFERRPIEPVTPVCVETDVSSSSESLLDTIKATTGPLGDHAAFIAYAEDRMRKKASLNWSEVNYLQDESLKRCCALHVDLDVIASERYGSSILLALPTGDEVLVQGTKLMNTLFPLHIHFSDEARCRSPPREWQWYWPFPSAPQQFQRFEQRPSMHVEHADVAVHLHRQQVKAQA